MEANATAREEVQPVSIEAGMKVLLEEAKAGVQDRYRACEEGIRRSPVKAVLGGVAAGYCLHRLPLKELAVANVRLAAALAPPALLFYGVAKVYEFLQRQGRAGVGIHPMEYDD